MDYTADRVYNEMNDILKYEYLKYDPGEDMSNLPCEHYWDCEEEPIPALIDNWAKLRLPIKVRPKKVDHVSIRDSKKRPTTSGSLRSLKSRGSRRTTASANKSQTLTSPLVQLTPSSSKRFTSSRQSKIREKSICTPAQELELREKEMRQKQFQQREQEYKEQRRLLLQQQKEEQEKMAKQLAKIKNGQDYTIDKNGEVIIVQKIPPNHLAGPIELELAIRNEGEDDEDEENNNKKKKRRNKNGNTQSTNKSTTTKSRTNNNNNNNDEQQLQHFIPRDSIQPSLIKTMELQTGVLIRDQTGMKQGPQFVEDPKHRRRQTEKPPALNPEEVDPSTSLTLTQTNNNSSSSGNINSDENLNNSSSTPIPPSMFDSLIDIPGEVIDYVDTTNEETKKEDINLQLVMDPTWGTNPQNAEAYKPNKKPESPDKYHRFEALGSITNKPPRERANIDKTHKTLADRLLPEIGVATKTIKYTDIYGKKKALIPLDVSPQLNDYTKSRPRSPGKLTKTAIGDELFKNVK